MADKPSITILAIDDDADVLARIANILESAGYCCHGAHDAESAREAARRATPDLIISDISLVGLSGLTICEQLKEQAGLCDVPVMLLSAGQVPDIIRRSHAAGGIYYLRKPFDESVLLQLIEKVRSASPAKPMTSAPVAPSRPIIAGEPLKPASARILASRASALAVQ